jgi:hypothetical protein
MQFLAETLIVFVGIDSQSIPLAVFMVILLKKVLFVRPEGWYVTAFEEAIGLHVTSSKDDSHRYDIPTPLSAETEVNKDGVLL